MPSKIHGPPPLDSPGAHPGPRWRPPWLLFSPQGSDGGPNGSLLAPKMNQNGPQYDSSDSHFGSSKASQFLSMEQIT